jgi:hypothetical protein
MTDIYFHTKLVLSKWLIRKSNVKAFVHFAWPLAGSFQCQFQICPNQNAKEDAANRQVLGAYIIVLILFSLGSDIVLYGPDE